MNLGQRPNSYTMSNILATAVEDRIGTSPVNEKVIVHHYTDIKGIGVQVEYEHHRCTELGTKIKFGRITL